MPSSWVGRSPMRAWTWWLLPFSCTLSPSPLPGDVLHLSPGQEVPLGSAVILAASVHMGEVTEPRGRRGSKTPPPPTVQTKGSRLPRLWGAGHVAGPLTLCSLLPLSSPQVGFLRFLFLMSTFDWKNNPLIVNLNNELTGKRYDESQTIGRTTVCGLRRRAGKGFPCQSVRFSLLTAPGMSAPDSGCLGMGKC